jgi:MFS family permease
MEAASQSVSDASSKLSLPVATTLLLASSLTVLSGAIIAPALPLIQEAFADQPHVALLSRMVMTVPALAIAVTAPFAGALTDLFGRKPILLICLILYALAGSSGWYLDDLYAILAGRFFLGVAVAGIMTSASAMIGDLLQGQARQAFLGKQAAFMAFGGVVFVPAGGALATLGWHAPFTVYLAALVMLPVALVVLNESRRKQPPRDEQGAVQVSQAGRFDRSSLVRILILAVLLQIAFYLGPVQVPYFVQENLGGTSLQSGLAIGLLTLAAGSASLGFSATWRVTPPLRIALLTALTMAAGCGLIALATSWWLMIPALIIFGGGAGWIMPNLMGWSMRIASPSTRGKIAGFVTAGIFARQFLSPLTVQPIVQSYSLRAAFGVMACGLVVLAGWLVLLRQTPPAKAADR